MSQEYQDAFLGAEYEACLKQRYERRQAAQAEWVERHLAERVRLHTKDKKEEKAAVLSNEFITALRVEIVTKYRIDELDAEVERLTKERDDKLNTLAETVDFLPQEAICKVDSCSTNTYRSQGYGMHTYAKGFILPMEDKLKKMGFEAEIRFAKLEDGERGMYNCGDYGDYELWANCPPWMYDAATRVATMQESLDYWKAHYVDALVYNPFLPNSVL